MASRYDAILAAIPTSLVGGALGEQLLAGVAEAVPFFALGLVVALILVGRALFAVPSSEFHRSGGVSADGQPDGWD